MIDSCFSSVVLEKSEDEKFSCGHEEHWWWFHSNLTTAPCSSAHCWTQDTGFQYLLHALYCEVILQCYLTVCWMCRSQQCFGAVGREEIQSRQGCWWQDSDLQRGKNDFQTTYKWSSRVLMGRTETKANTTETDWQEGAVAELDQAPTLIRQPRGGDQDSVEAGRETQDWPQVELMEGKRREKSQQKMRALRAEPHIHVSLRLQLAPRIKGSLLIGNTWTFQNALKLLLLKLLFDEIYLNL